MEFFSDICLHYPEMDSAMQSSAFIHAIESLLVVRLNTKDYCIQQVKPQLGKLAKIKTTPPPHYGDKIQYWSVHVTEISRDVF